MKHIKKFAPFLLLFGMTLFFFYNFFLSGLLPFPGNLLLSEYNPWKYTSFFGYNPGSIPNKAQYFDTILQLYPWRTLAVDLMMIGRLPLWNPYNFSGSPLLANLQSSPFYPMNIMYLFLSYELAWSFLVILQPLMATIFMYLYIRTLRVTMLPSVFSAISYGFSLYMTVFLEYNTLGHIVSLLPLTLYAFERYNATLGKRYLMFLSLSIAISFFAGHLQLGVTSFGFVLMYILVRLKSKNMFSMRKISFFIFFMFIGLLLSAIQLIPAFELISLSARVSQDYQYLTEKLLMQPAQLIMIFIPDIFGNPVTRNFLPHETYPTKAAYIGILPLLFAFFSLSLFRKKCMIRFFAVIAAILLIVLTRNPLSEIFYLLDLPLISSSSPTNMWYVFGFCLSVLGGFGLQHVMDSKKIPFKIFLVFLTLFICSFIFSFFSLREFIQIKQVIIPVGIFLFGLVVLFVIHVNKLKYSFFVVLFVILTVFDLFYLFQKFNPFSQKASLYPPVSVASWLSTQALYNRVLGIGNAYIAPNLHTELRLYSPEGYDPLYPKLYGEFLHSYQDGQLLTEFTNQTRSNALLGDIFGDGSLVENERRLKIIDFLGVKYILDRVENGNTEKTFPSDRFSIVYEEDGWKIYENKYALPRGFLVQQASIVESKDDFGKIFYSDTFDPKASVILEKHIALPNVATPSGEVILFRLEEDRIHYQTSSENDSVFVLSDTYYPGWKAFIDGEETDILRANHAFRGVYVPKGIHDVTFFYYPNSFLFGMYVSLISSIVFIGSLFYFKKN